MTSSLGYHHFVSHTGWPIHPQVYGKKSRIWPLLPIFSSPGHCYLLPGSVHLRLLAAALACPPYNRSRLRLHSETAHVTLCPLSWYDSATFPSVPTPNSAVATQLPCCSMHQVGTCLKAFALAVPSHWKPFPQTPKGSSSCSFQVIAHMLDRS